MPLREDPGHFLQLFSDPGTSCCHCNSLVELVFVLPIHVVTVVSTAVFLRHILPTDVSIVALEAIEFSDGVNPWIVVSSIIPGVTTTNSLFGFTTVSNISFGGFGTFRILVERLLLQQLSLLACWFSQYFFN